MMLSIKAGDSLADVQWLLYIFTNYGCYCMHALWYKQVGPISRCSVVTNCKILVLDWCWKLPIWFSYALTTVCSACL